MTGPSATGDHHPTGAAAGASVVLLATIAGLHLLGRGALALPPLGSLVAIEEWAAERDPVTIAMAAARLVALGVAYHLVATTLLAVLGTLLRRPALVRAADTATIPLLRGAMPRTAGLVLSLAAVLAGPFAPAAGSGRSGATLSAVERPDPARADRDRVAASHATLRRTPDEPLPAPATTTPAARRHRVRPGDHLWSIAESALAERLGRPPTDAEVDPFWREVVAANAQLTDPDLLLPGELITVPPVPGAPVEVPSGTATLHAEPGG